MVIHTQLQVGQRNRLLRWFDPHLVVLHQCRHPLNRLEHVRGHSIVPDVDDADFLDSMLSAEMEHVARHAKGVICGSLFIQDWAAGLCDNTEIIWTGSPVLPGPSPRGPSENVL